MTKTGAKAKYFFGFLLALMLTAGVLVPVQPTWAQTIAADLSIRKFDFPPDTVSVGEPLFFELRVSNDVLSPNTAENVVVTDLLPANTRFLFPFAGSDCTSTGRRIVTCDLGDLAPGRLAVAEFAVCPTEPGIAENIATVESDTPDLILTNNADEQTTEVTEPAVAGGGCLSQELQPPPPSGGAPDDGVPGNGTANNGTPEITQGFDQEAESGDIEQSFEIG